MGGGGGGGYKNVFLGLFHGPDELLYHWCHFMLKWECYRDLHMNLHRIENNEPGLFLDMTCSVYFQMIWLILL